MSEHGSTAQQQRLQFTTVLYSVSTKIINVSGGSRIFLRGAPTLKVGVLTYFAIFFAENCMEMKEFGPGGRGRGMHPWPPSWIRQ